VGHDIIRRISTVLVTAVTSTLVALQPAAAQDHAAQDYARKMHGLNIETVRLFNFANIDLAYAHALYAIDVAEQAQGLHYEHGLALQNLGAVAMRAGDFSEAAEHYARGLEALGQAPSDLRVNLAIIALHSNRGALLISLSEFDEGEREIMDALELADVIGPDADVMKSNALAVLAQHNLRKGHFALALDHAAESAALRERLFGLENEKTAEVWRIHANVLVALGRYQESIEEFGRAIDIQDRRLGRNTDATASSLLGRASAYSDMGLSAEAEADAIAALDAYRASVGVMHPSTAAALNTLGAIQLSDSRLDEAYDNFTEALEIRKLVLGERHVDVATSHNNICAVYFGADMFAEAVSHCDTAIAILQSIDHTESSVFAMALLNLGSSQNGLGYYSEAMSNLLDAVDRIDAVFGPEHLRAADARQALGLAQWRMGEYDDALTTFQTVHEARARMLGDSHPQTTTTLSSIGEVLRQLKRFDEADNAYERSLEHVLTTTEPTGELERIIRQGQIFVADDQEQYDVALARARTLVETTIGAYGRGGGEHYDDLLVLVDALVAADRQNEALDDLDNAREIAFLLWGETSSQYENLTDYAAELRATGDGE